MPDIEFNCRHCNQSMTVDESGAGMILQCSGCGKDVTIPQLSQPLKARTGVKFQSSLAQPTPSTATINTKKCPFCAEKILQEAIKCKHCGSMLGKSNHTPAKLYLFICPECQFEVETTEESVNQLVICSNCQQEVHLRRKLQLKASPRVFAPEQTESTSPTDLADNPSSSRCPSCRSAIARDTVFCVNCGLNLKTGVRFSTTSAPGLGSIPNLWNPRAAVNWFIFFSPAFSSWLLAHNWQELGDSVKARRCRVWFWIWLIFGLVLQVSFLDRLLSSNPSMAVLITIIIIFFIVLGVLIFWYQTLGWSQIKYVEGRRDGIKKVYNKNPWGKPLGIGFACLVFLYMLRIGLNSLGGSSLPDNKSLQDKPLSAVELASKVKPEILEKLRKIPELAKVEIDIITDQSAA